MTKEALIGEDNLKPLLTVLRESIVFWVGSAKTQNGMEPIGTAPIL